MKRKTEGRKPITRMSRTGRDLQLIQTIYFWGQYYELTQTQIAWWVNLRPSSYLLKTLKRLAEQGFLKVREEEYSTGRFRFLFSISAKGEQVAERNSLGSLR